MRGYDKTLRRATRPTRGRADRCIPPMNETTPMEGGAFDPKGVIAPRSTNWIRSLGLVNAFCFAAAAFLSYGLASVVQLSFAPQPREAEFLARLAESLAALGPNVQAFVTGHTVFARPEWYVPLYCLPLLITSAVFIAALICLARQREHLTADVPRRLARWAMVFAAVCVLALPTLAQDFWLSAAWGRMFVEGHNPYHTSLSTVYAEGLPFDDFNRRMTYGPLWAVVSGCVMWLSGGSVLVAAALFKLLLAGAWIAALGLIQRLLRDRTLWHQSVGIVIFGWLPVSVVQTVADGHNDIFMMLGVIAWLYALKRGHETRAIVFLAASVLAKYVSAPLFLVHAIFLLRARGRSYREICVQLGVGVAIVATGIALFIRSSDFFAPAASMLRWRFLSPADAISGLATMAGLAASWIAPGVQLLAIAIGFAFVVRYARRPSRVAFHTAALGLLAAALFGAVGHVWPWFLIWLLPFAALESASAPSRAVVGVALALPIGAAIFLLNQLPFFSSEILWVATAIIYVLAALWLWLAPRRWFPPTVA